MIVPNNEHPQKMKKGGKVNGKGIKGYVEGGTIDTGPTVVGEAPRKYSNKFKDYAQDLVVGSADGLLNVAGLENAIKDKDYKTQTGSQWNTASRGLGKIGREVSGGVLNYFVPGLGTAVNAGLSQPGKLVGEDTGVPEKDRLLQDKVAKGVGMVGSLTGAMNPNNKKEKDKSDPAVGSSTVDPSIPGVDTSAGNATAKPIDYVSQLSGQYLIDYNNASEGEAKQNVLDAFIAEQMNQGKANGGKIVGPGTAKSDSIKAKAEDGDFIVPAENAKKAEELREKYLGGSGKKVAPLKKGDVPVKLSNGEHKFTKAEYDLLVAKGIDVDALAPNAEDGNELAKGGEVGGEDVVEKSKKILSKKAKESADIKKLAADYDKRIKDQEDRATYEKRLSLLKRDIEGYSSNVEKSNNAINRKALEKAISEYDNVKSEYDTRFSGAKKGNSALEAMNLPKGVGLATAEDEKRMSAKKTATSPLSAAGNSLPVKNTGGIASVGVSNKIKKSPLDDVKFDTSMTSEEDAQKQADDLAAQTAETTSVPEYDSKTLALRNSLEGVTPEPAQPATTGKRSPFELLDAGKALGFGQTALGIKELIEDGKRPVDNIDPEFSQTVKDAKKDAMYGISPLERSIAENNIETNRRADVQNIINLSGGSAGTALGNIRAASLVANDANNNLSAASESLRLQKKRYADNRVDALAGMRRQLFEDKLSAFNTDQAAGAALVGAGIQNVIGANRFDRALKAERERANIGKGADLPGITKKSEIQTLAGVVPTGTTDKDAYYRTFAKSKGFDWDSLTTNV